MRSQPPLLFVMLIALSLVGSGGCALGPAALQANRTAYNRVVQTTTAEQLLLNLVRLHYREAPLFLDVGSIATQFTIEQSGRVGALIVENFALEPPNPNELELGAGIAYREQPTVTFTPLQGEDFVKRLLSPIHLETILLLTRSGWSIDRVLRVTVQRMNGLDNASNASSPTPDRAPRFEEFARVSAAFRELQKRGALQLGYVTRDREAATPVSYALQSLVDVMAAAREGYSLRRSPDGRWTLYTTETVLVWRIRPDEQDSAEVQEIVAGLGLVPGQDIYEIREIGGDFEPADPPGQRTRIEVATRSVLGALFYLSQAIEVPQVHRQQGAVTTTLDADGSVFDWRRVTGGLLEVRSQPLVPSRAAVRVYHRGHWFYIDDADLTSKSTFALLGQLFALQAGAEPGVGPLLTLPVGG